MCVCVCVYVCMCVCVYVCMCTIYIYDYMICKYVCWAPHIWLVPYNAGATCWDPSWVMARPSTSWWARSRWLSPATSMLRWTREVPNISCRAALSWQWMSGSTAPWIPMDPVEGFGPWFWDRLELMHGDVNDLMTDFTAWRKTRYVSDSWCWFQS